MTIDATDNLPNCHTEISSQDSSQRLDRGVDTR